MKKVEPASKILVIVVARIGDTLLVTPILRALREAIPNGRLTVLAHPKRAEVLRNLSFIDELGTITKYRAVFRGRLSRPVYDHAVVYGHDQSLLEFASRVSRHVIAFRKAVGNTDAEDQLGSKVSWIEWPGNAVHAVDGRAAVLDSLGVTLADKRLAYQVTPAEASAAAQWIKTQFGARPNPLLAMQPVSFPTKKYRDWGVENFVGLISGILERWPDAGFILLGGINDTAQVAPIAARFAGRCALAAGRTTLRESAALIAASDLYVGVDTGPTHLAGAVGVPMVALYHCAHPGRFLIPLQNPNLRYVEHPKTGLAGAGMSDASMDEILVEDVLREALELLERRAALEQRSVAGR